MSAPLLTQQTPIQNVVIDPSTLSSPSSQSLWDRISRWVSENKAAVYTVAGVAVVVTGAGVIYYLSDSKKASQESPVPRKSKNQRRKEKKAEEERKAQEEQAAGTGTWCHHLDRIGLTTVLNSLALPKQPEESSEELPEVNEAIVESLSQEV